MLVIFFSVAQESYWNLYFFAVMFHSSSKSCQHLELNSHPLVHRVVFLLPFHYNVCMLPSRARQNFLSTCSSYVVSYLRQKSCNIFMLAFDNFLPPVPLLSRCFHRSTTFLHQRNGIPLHYAFSSFCIPFSGRPNFCVVVVSIFISFCSWRYVSLSFLSIFTLISITQFPNSILLVFILVI